MNIQNSLLLDTNQILELYKDSIDLKKESITLHHFKIEKILITIEIKNKKQWKITSGKEIICVFTLSFEIPFIWLEKNNNSSIYINRIIISPKYNYLKLFSKIIEWVKEYVRFKKIHTIKIHTDSKNETLIAYFKKYGFEFDGCYKLENKIEQKFNLKNNQTSRFKLNIKPF